VQYELRRQVIETQRPTFTPLINRYGDRPATRYEEASIDIQPTENFHYRPLWAPQHEIYDETYSALRLTDPYAFTDPRQYYYTPYVSNRAALHDAFGKTLDYVVDRELLAKLPDHWRAQRDAVHREPEPGSPGFGEADGGYGLGELLLHPRLAGRHSAEWAIPASAVKVATSAASSSQSRRP